MVPQNYQFGGGASSSYLNPFVLVAMIVVIILMMALPRKYLSIPFLAIAILVPVGQVLMIGGLHLFVLRIVILFTLARIFASAFTSEKPIFSGGLNILDKLFIAWAILHVVTFTLQFMVAAAFINQCSFLLDALGGYIILRYAIQDEEDIARAIKTLAAVAIVVAVGMLDEKFRDQNPFGFLGNFILTPVERDGAIRAQGPFLHPLLAGTYGATLLALSLWLWHTGKSKTLAVLGSISATIIVLTSASSTPVLAYAATIFALCLWPLRKNMRALRWGIVVALLGMQLVMKAPVWFAIAHIDLTGSSSGYHRALLIDQFLRHFGDWWLIGTNDNQKWGFDLWDTENTFVAEGQQAGLATLVCFIAMISVCYRWIGNARKSVEGDQTKEFMYWLFGAAMFAHVVSYFGVVYFDHMLYAWLLLLASICVAKEPSVSTVPVPEKKQKLALSWPAVATPAQATSPFGTIRSRQPN